MTRDHKYLRTTEHGSVSERLSDIHVTIALYQCVLYWRVFRCVRIIPVSSLTEVDRPLHRTYNYITNRYTCVSIDADIQMYRMNI